MLSLHASVRRKCKGIIGYSGAFLGGSLPDKVFKNDTEALEYAKKQISWLKNKI